jgi:hypothetical protein
MNDSTTYSIAFGALGLIMSIVLYYGISQIKDLSNARRKSTISHQEVREIKTSRKAQLAH